MIHILNRIQVVLFICYAVSLPFSIEHFKHTSFFTIFIIANSILLCVFNRFRIQKEFKNMALAWILLYVIYSAGYFIAENKSQTLFVLEKKLALILFPLVYLFTPPMNHRDIKMVLQSFYLGCVYSAIYCLALAFSHFVIWNDPAFFSYRLLSSNVGIHPIYLSMFYLFGFIVALYVYFNSLANFSRVKKFLYYSSLILLSVTITLLAGRVSVALLVLSVMVYAIARLRSYISLLKSVLVAILIGLAVVIVFLLPPKNRTRLKEAINYKGEYSVNKVASGAVVRPYIWSCAVTRIQEHPIIGWGAGDTDESLARCYEDRNYSFLTEADHMRFNAHNQFLEVCLAAGIPALLLFLYGMYLAYIKSKRNKQMLYTVFILIVIISCITESLLERQSGIAFFAFMNGLLFFYKQEETAEDTVVS